MDSGRDELDRLIDGALGSYAEAEPLVGLEQRVVNRVRVARARRRWLAWGVGAAVAAGMAVGILEWSGQRAVVRKTPAAVVARVGPQVVERSAVLANKQRAGVRVKRVKQPTGLPKLEQFPTPSPMTEEERALVAAAHRHPEELKLFADMERRANSPIEIEPIQIAPLQNDSEQ